jgi:hypothetical protein
MKSNVRLVAMDQERRRRRHELSPGTLFTYVAEKLTPTVRMVPSGFTVSRDLSSMDLIVLGDSPGSLVGAVGLEDVSVLGLALRMRAVPPSHEPYRLIEGEMLLKATRSVAASWEGRDGNKVWLMDNDLENTVVRGDLETGSFFAYDNGPSPFLGPYFIASLKRLSDRDVGLIGNEPGVFGEPWPDRKVTLLDAVLIAAA